MIMKKMVITALAIFWSINYLMAQDLRFGYFQTNHMYLLHPGAVSSDPEQIFLEYGRQWSELAASPEVFQLGGVFHSSQKLSFGGIINRNSSGILDRYHFGITTGYRVNLAPKQSLSAGISTHIKNNNIVLDNIIADMSDPILSGGQYEKTYFGLGLGLNYSYENLKAYFSIPETHYFGDSDLGGLINGGLSYDFFLNDYMVTPSVNYFGTPLDKIVEGMVMVGWKNIIRMGAGYRSDNSFGFRLEFRSGAIALGYAIANSSGNYKGTGVSNNFSVRYIFDQDRFETDQKINSIVETNERILSRMDAEKDSTRMAQAEILQRLDALTHQQDTVQDLQRNFLEKYEEADRKNTVDEATDKEVEPGYYLVIYSFHDSTELNKIEEELVSLPFETQLIHDKDKSFYYISTRRFDTLEMAVIGMQSVRNQGFSEAWIHWYK